MPMNSIAVVRSRSKSLSLGCTLMAAAAFFVLFTEGAAPATQIGAPAMDHHQHLFSPTLADLVNGTPAPGTTVSAELRNLLEQRAANWHSPGALKGLLASDAEAFTRGAFGWVHGRDAVADHLASDYLGREYFFTPTHERVSGNQATVTGYYSRGTKDNPAHFAYFTITAEKGADANWRITQEVVIPFSPQQQPITADKLIVMLDEAGIGRAVVLSEAFWYDGPLLKVEDPYPKVIAENDWTAKEVARYPSRLVAFCSFNPVADHALTELERCWKSGAFAGYKFSFAMSAVDLTKPEHLERVKRVFVAINRHKMPIVVHISNGPGYSRAHAEAFLDQVMTVAPDVDVQVAHLWGGEAYTQGAIDEFVEAFKEHRPSTRHLYFDLAEVWTANTPENLAAAAAGIRSIGIDRMFYGSDAALNGRLRPLQAWRMLRVALPLTDSEFAHIANQKAPYLPRAWPK